MDKQSNSLLSLKNDFVFKLMFGDENRKDLLAAFLSAILSLPEIEFTGLEIINNELLREFKEDKKGILDVRVRTRAGKQIDIEIQILPTEYMPQRTLYYWSRMYTSQVKSGDMYDKLKKCITINIVDFECIPVKRVHTSFHLTEENTGYKLTDAMEIHFLELPKLLDQKALEAEDEAVIDWMMFIGGNSEGVMEMLAEKNEKIRKAYKALQLISKDDYARMMYEAREAELKDQLTRIKEAEERGKLEGKLEGKREVARNFLAMGLPVDSVVKATGLSPEEVEKLKSRSDL